MRLSDHFTSREFTCHDGTPAPQSWLIDAQRLCIHYLEPLRQSFGPVTIVSGYRTQEYNRQVGGAPASYHTKIRGRPGAAADIRCARGTPAAWHRFLDDYGVEGLGAYPAHTHLDNRRGHARW